MKHKSNVDPTLVALKQILRKQVFQLGGRRAGTNDTIVLREYYSAWLYELLDLCYKDPLIQFPDVETFTVILHMDQLDLVNFYNDVYYSVNTDKHTSFTAFKAWLYESYRGVPFLFLLKPIVPLLKEYFRLRSVTPEIMRKLSQYLRFGCKLSFSDLDLETSALHSFLSNEQRMLDLDLTCNPFIKGLHEIILEWFKPLKIDFVPARHGTGSVAEGSLSKGDKYRHLSSDNLLNTVLNWNHSDLSHLKYYYPLGVKDGHAIRTNKVIFVPKNATKLRTICMEPATLQFFQQGVMDRVYDYISHHEYLSTIINLEDQTDNQRGAQLGSLFGIFSTIDLSAASDSVSWVLAKVLFRGTDLYKWMIATRSRYTVLPTGETISTAKYAPMGSALCFPIECIIFAAVVEYCGRMAVKPYTTVHQWYGVYGDDLVVPSSWTRMVIRVLSSIGFIINTDKSYYDGPFRESCGKEYYRGVDTTPLYYRLDPVGNKLTPDVYSALCSHANLAYEHGLSYLRSYYVDLLMHWCCKRRNKEYPLFNTMLGRSPFIYSPEATNFQNWKRWNQGLQLMEVRYLSTSSKKDVETLCDHEIDTISYAEWLIRTYFRPRRTDKPDVCSTKHVYSRTTLVYHTSIAQYPI